MNADEMPTARAPARMVRSVGLGAEVEEEGGMSAKSFVMETPMREAKSWPRMALRGWEKGDSMALRRRMDAAPCEVGRMC